jgi:hypothetical protein
MDNRRNRLDVQDALSSGSSIADRYSTTIETSLRYYALLVFRQSEVIGIYRAG